MSEYTIAFRWASPAEQLADRICEAADALLKLPETPEVEKAVAALKAVADVTVEVAHVR